MLETTFRSSISHSSVIGMMPAEPIDAALLMARMGRWHWTVGDNQMLFSPSIYSIFQFDTALFQTELTSLRNLIPAQDLNRLFVFINTLLADGQSGSLDFSLHHPHAPQTEFFVRCHGCAQRNAHGTITALSGIFQDITLEHRNNAALKHALEETEAANRAKSRFLATMSHELRTPLNAIIGFSEMMHAELLGPLGNARYSDYAGSINESGRYLLDLINDILDMSKIEAGKYDLVHEPVNVPKAVRLACHMIENTVREKDLTVTIQASTENATIEADRRAFMQILLNLLSNAAKFTPHKGRIAIHIVDSDSTHMAITIADTGIGIPADKISRIGQPFEQISSAMTRGHGGTGLGLAITKKLVEMHGGTLNISSVFGQGTTVTVTLPSLLNQKQYDLFHNGKSRADHDSFE